MSKRLNALQAERDGVRAALASIEDASVDAIGRATELEPEQKTKIADLLTREGELSTEIEAIWKREQNANATAEIVAEMDKARNGGLVRAAAGADLTGISAGEYALEFLKANLKQDSGALERITAIHRAAVSARDGVIFRAQDLTTDLAGILPTPIIGDLIKFVDSSRNAINASRNMPMPANGKTFTRPRATQRTTAAVQSAEGAALSSQKMTLVGDTVTKGTYGGFVEVTEQDIDWTDPAFLQILFEDLADSYAIQTSAIHTAAILAAGVTNKTIGFTAGTSAWTVFLAKLVLAVTAVYTNSKKLPDTLFAAPDVWGDIIGYTDTTNRPIFPGASSGTVNVPGESITATAFGGANPLGLTLVVDPNFAAGACVVGASRYAEYYEQNKGLATIAAPSIMAVDVAYRGYFASNCYAQGFSSMQAT